MRISKEELKILCEIQWDDEIHQSKLFDSKKPEYKYKILHRKNVYKVDNQEHTIKIISTNDDRDQIYRLEFSSSDLKKLFNKDENNEFFFIYFKDNKWYFKDKENDIHILSKAETKEINGMLVDIYKN